MVFPAVLRRRVPEPGTGTRPHEVRASLLDINFAELAERGLRHLILDIDNTLALKGVSEIPEEYLTFLRSLRETGTIQDLCLVSNVVFRNELREARVRAIAKHLNVQYHCAFWPYCKPAKLPFQMGLAILGSQAKNTIMVGDQLLTDIRGANRLGLYTIWVQPLGEDGWHSRYKRGIERRLVRRWPQEKR